MSKNLWLLQCAQAHFMRERTPSGMSIRYINSRTWDWALYYRARKIAPKARVVEW